MRDYGKVHTSYWTSTTIRSMTEDGRTLAMYLLTCPHGTIAGVFRLPDGYACEDLQWDEKRVQEGFAELLANGFANRCETTKWVWVTKHLEWNQPENPNQRKAVAKIATQVPAECAWNLDFMRVCGKFWGAETPAEAKGLETVKQPFLNQEQEQEQEQEQDIDAPSALQPKSPRGTSLRSDWQLPDDWKSWAEKERPDLDAAQVADSFRDFWIAKPGKDGRKADWLATWRNWVRNQRSPPMHAPKPERAMGSFV